MMGASPFGVWVCVLAVVDVWARVPTLFFSCCASCLGAHAFSVCGRSWPFFFFRLRLSGRGWRVSGLLSSPSAASVRERLSSISCAGAAIKASWSAACRSRGGRGAVRSGGGRGEVCEAQDGGKWGGAPWPLALCQPWNSWPTPREICPFSFFLFFLSLTHLLVMRTDV